MLHSSDNVHRFCNPNPGDTLGHRRQAIPRWDQHAATGESEDFSGKVVQPPTSGR